MILKTTSDSIFFFFKIQNVVTKLVKRVHEFLAFTNLSDVEISLISIMRLNMQQPPKKLLITELVSFRKPIEQFTR